MKILQIESSPGWGGQELRILEESKGMQGKGHDLFFIVQKEGGLSKRLKEFNFSFRTWNFKKRNALFILFFLIYHALKLRVDVINTHSSLDSWLGGIVGKLLGIKVVRTRHLSSKIKGGLNSYLLYNFLADVVVTTCEETAQVLKKQARLDAKRCLSIPTGVKPFCVKRREKSTKLCVGTLCVIRSWKGISDFLQAAHILRDKSGITWKIIGGGVSEEFFRKQCQEMDLQEKVTFTGHLENPFEELNSLDIFLLLSYAHEGVSQATLQAAWLKKPLITTRIGGLKEVCLHQETGLIVDTNAPQQVADAVMILCASETLRAQMGKKAHELVKERFMFDQMVDQMEMVFFHGKKCNEGR